MLPADLAEIVLGYLPRRCPAAWLPIWLHGHLERDSNYQQEVDRTTEPSPNAHAAQQNFANALRFDCDRLHKLPGVRRLEWMHEHAADVNWCKFSMYTSEVDWLREHPEHIRWGWLSANAAAAKLLAENPDKIEGRSLYLNSAAVVSTDFGALRILLS